MRGGSAGWHLHCVVSLNNPVQCTLYSVQCTVYSIQCTVYSVQCTVYSVQCTVDSGQWTVDSVQCTVYSGQCTVDSGQCTVYSVQWTVYSAQCTMYNVQCLHRGRTFAGECLDPATDGKRRDTEVNLGRDQMLPFCLKFQDIMGLLLVGRQKKP